MSLRNHGRLRTKKTFKVNKGNGQQAPAAFLQADEIRSSDDHHQRNSSHSSFEPNGTYRQTSNQNYSSRNSLRAAQSATHNFVPDTSLDRLSENQSLPYTMPESIGPTQLPPSRCLEDSSNYLLLSSECFIREIGDFLICMLCGKRERRKGHNAVDQHLESQSHNFRYIKFRFAMLDKPLDDFSLQMTAINELLSRWYNSQILTANSIAVKLAIVDELNLILESHFPESYGRLIGSFASGTPLKDSDINIELVHPSSNLFEKDPRAKNSVHHILVEPNAEYGKQFNNHALYYDLAPNAIYTMYKLIELLDNSYRNYPLSAFQVVSSINDLNGKVPRLVLKHIDTDTNVEVNCYVNSSHQLSTLLGIYMSLDERARILSILVKYWAKVCGINKPEQGTFPPYTFVILVIHYLQRTSPPILPCLHQIFCDENRPETKQPEVIAAEQLELLDLNNHSRNLNKEDVATETEQIPDNLEPDEVDLDDEEEEEAGLFDEESLRNINWSSSNQTQINGLFIDFLKYYIKEFDDLESVISIRTLKRVGPRSRKWGVGVKAIENPVRPRNNLSRCIGTVRIFDYIKNCFKFGYYYLTSVPIELSMQPKSTSEVNPEDFTSIYYHSDRIDNYFHYKEKMIKTTVSYDSIREMINQNLFERDVEVINSLFDRAEGGNQLSLLPSYVARFYNESLLLPRDTICTTFCWLCRRSGGHTRQSCPQAKLDNLRREAETYDTNLDFRADFDKDFINAYRRDKITPQLADEHAEAVKRLSDLIISATGLKCHLQLFGSTVNNLGSYDSDLDICMTIQGSLSGRDVDCVAILQRVAEVLNMTSEASDVEAVLTARVPIIKFRFRSFDIDLSMYNQCAIFNSKLLKTYSEIDNRVGILFYLVKRYAKACGIADATRGSLSSYAWSLLVIHYLQNTNPPILPVLQEPTPGERMSLIGVNGWNVWFDSKPDVKSMPPNNLTITQLFKGFFLYYGNFDFDYLVVSIRRKGPMTRFQKSWNNCTMALEDPFELTYNLASRLDDLMSIYIINSFSQAFRHIVLIQQNKASRHSNWSSTILIKRLFSGRDITGSKPPYRGCRICHKIGHKLKDCPSRIQNPNRQSGGNEFKIAR